MQVPAPGKLLDFGGQVALVTGAGRGLGRTIALRFAQAAAAVAVHYHRSREGADDLVRAIGQAGGRAATFAADLTRAEEAADLVDAVVNRLGGLNVLINNSGVYPVAPLLDMTPQQWREVAAANLDSAHFCTQAAAQHMRAHGGGAIVNIASIEADNVAPGHSHYSAAKAGIVMYTRSAAQELGTFSIRVNCISPGLIWQPGLDEAWPEGVAAYRRAVPLGRLGQADDVADACLFLASPAARWITGANLVVDGGVLTNRAF